MLTYCSQLIVHFVETCFERWGRWVSTNNRPYYVILGSIIFVILASLGLLTLTTETDSECARSTKSSSANAKVQAFLVLFE